MALLQAAGLFMSIAGQYSSAKAANEQIEADNALKAQQWEQNRDLTALVISRLSYKTDRAVSEAVRDSVRTKMIAQKAAHAAEGAATVQAAHLGTGVGKRASLATYKPSSREAGDMINDANVNLQTDLTNIVEHYNETAMNAIANLNNASPIFGSGASTTQMLIDAAGSGLNYYNSMSSASKSELSSLFKGSSGVQAANLYDAPTGYETTYSNIA